MSRRRRPRPPDLELGVRSAVMELVRRREVVTALSIAERIEAGGVEAPLDRIGRVLRQLYEAGLLRPFGYRRTLAQIRTRQGTVTAVSYAPPVSERSTVRPPGSKSPTRAPAARVYGYLDLPYRQLRRLERQTEALRDRMQRSAEERIAAGEILLAIRALVGPEGLRHYLARELNMSPDTARRLIQVAEVFRQHPRVALLSVIRPTALYLLAQSSFPAELRDRILEEEGLVVDGARRRLEALRVSDLRLAKRRYAERSTSARALGLELDQLRGQGQDEARIAAVEGRLAALKARPITHVETAAPDAEQASLGELASAVERLASAQGITGLSEEARTASIESLRRLLAELEGKRR